MVVPALATMDRDYLRRNKTFFLIFKLTENTNLNINFNIMKHAYSV